MGSRLCKGREVEGSQECVCAEKNKPERVAGGRVPVYKRACLLCSGREEGRAMRVAKLPPRGASCSVYKRQVRSLRDLSCYKLLSTEGACSSYSQEGKSQSRQP